MAEARDRRRTLDGFAEINHDAAGIDVGNAEHWVAVPAGGVNVIRRNDTDDHGHHHDRQGIRGMT